MLSVTENK